MNDAGARYARGLRRYLTLGGLAWEWKDDMTEQDWLASEDPDRMVAWLCEPVQVSCPVCGGSGDCGGGVGLPRYCGTCHGTGETCPPGWVYVGDRKLRLFACACCRAAWPLPAAEGCRLALDVAERYADGLVTEVDRGQAHADACWRAAVPGTSRLPPLLLRTPQIFDTCALGQILDGTRGVGLAPATQATLLRDVVGNPWHPVWWSDDPKRHAEPRYGGEPPGPHPAAGPHLEMRRAWLTPAVRRIARGVYADRDFAALPVLADALEEAGCEDGRVLSHLRGPGPHCRGCWVVDMLLGKS
jgi:hypothetical protein